MVDKVIRDGKVAVLVSPKFGAGWSTCNPDIDQSFLLMDAGLIALRESNSYQDDNQDDVKQYIITKLDLQQDDVFLSLNGWLGVQVEWVPVGQHFYIKEYDGAERIVYLEDIPLILA